MRTKGHERQRSSQLRGIQINISSDPFQHRIPSYIQRLWQDSRLQRKLQVFKRRVRKPSWVEQGVVVLVLMTAGLGLLIHVGFFSGGKYQAWQEDHDRFEVIDLLDQVYSTEGRAQTTAVIRMKNDRPVREEIEWTTKPIIRQLCQYEMFSTLMIWNDDPIVPVTSDMVHVKGCTLKMVIINTPVRMGSAGRYNACQQSKTPYCYFQDIPRTSLQLRSTYANFLKSPQLIHGESSSHTSFINSQWRYCFSNSELELHTCSIDIESGTFVAKTMVTSFLQNYDETSVVDEFADMYFTTFMNQIPYQLEGDGSYSRELDKEELEHLDASLIMLYNDLEEEGEIALIPYIESTFERNARTSCKDDRCLFLTNIQVIPNIELFNYQKTNVELSIKMHDDYRVQFRDHRYSSAVDGNDKTSWKSIQNIKTGDYIGLDLLLPMRNPILYRFLVDQPYTYKVYLSIQISYNGLDWMKIHPSPTVSCQNLESSDLLECRFIIRDTGYRYIRLESQRDLDFKFDVYDFSFSAKVKKDEEGQLLDIALDEHGIIYIEED